MPRILPRRPEIGDAVDNDCDGEIDEDPAMASCNDGIGCTVNDCIAGGFCIQIPFDFTCDDFATCTDDRCVVAPSGTDPRDTTTFNPATGCSRQFRNSFCTDVWDDCECNGDETCAGLAPGTGPFDSRDRSGCVGSPRLEHACED